MRLRLGRQRRAAAVVRDMTELMADGEAPGAGMRVGETGRKSDDIASRRRVGAARPSALGKRAGFGQAHVAEGHPEPRFGLGPEAGVERFARGLGAGRPGPGLAGARPAGRTAAAAGAAALRAGPGDRPGVAPVGREHGFLDGGRLCRRAAYSWEEPAPPHGSIVLPATACPAHHGPRRHRGSRPRADPESRGVARPACRRWLSHPRSPRFAEPPGRSTGRRRAPPQDAWSAPPRRRAAPCALVCRAASARRAVQHPSARRAQSADRVSAGRSGSVDGPGSSGASGPAG